MKTITAIACLSLLIGCADVLENDPVLDEVEQASICGSTNDAQHVNSYDGTLGPTTSFVQFNKGGKGAMETTNGDDSSKFCSGSLISANLFLTAGHCGDATTVGQFVSFNFERAADSTALLIQVHEKITAVVEDELGGVDYAIARIESNLGDTISFPAAAVATAAAAIGSAITIIGHPNGEPKQIEAGTVAGISGNFCSTTTSTRWTAALVRAS